LYLQEKTRNALRKQTFILEITHNISYKYTNVVFLCDDVPKGQIIEAALKSMKQNKSDDLEVSVLPTEDVKVDELARHVYYTAKAIRRLALSEVKSSVSWPPTGSFINEQSVTTLNLL